MLIGNIVVWFTHYLVILTRYFEERLAFAFFADMIVVERTNCVFPVGYSLVGAMREYGQMVCFLLGALQASCNLQTRS